MLNKNILKIGSALFALSVSTALADTQGLSLAAYGGLNIAGGASFVPFKVGDLSPDTGMPMTQPEVEIWKMRSDAADISSGYDPCGGLGVRYSYDFGTDGDEIVGLEAGVSGFLKSNSMVEKLKNSSSSGSNKSTFMRIGIALDPAVRLHAFRYEGGSMFFTLGADIQYSLFNSYSEINDDKENKFESGYDKERKKFIEDKATNPFNIAGKLGIGFSVADNAVDFRINTRCWFLETVDREAEFDYKGSRSKEFERYSIGKYNFDVSLSVGYNFLA